MKVSEEKQNFQERFEKNTVPVLASVIIQIYGIPENCAREIPLKACPSHPY